MALPFLLLWGKTARTTIGSIRGRRGRKVSLEEWLGKKSPDPFHRDQFRAALEEFERKKPKARRALTTAFDLAREAIDAARQAELDREAKENLAKLNKALESAASSASVNMALRRAKAVQQYAEAVIRHLRMQQEQEDEAIIMLLLT